VGRPRKSSLPTHGHVLDVSGKRRARLKGVLGNQEPTGAGVDSLLRSLRKQAPQLQWTAAEVALGALVQLESAGQMWAEVPSRSVSDLLDMVERVQLGLALIAFVRPRKAQILYLAFLRDLLAGTMRSARSLPRTAEDLPPEVRALTTYFRLQRLLPAVAREIHRKFYSSGVLAKPDDVRRAATEAGLHEHAHLSNDELALVGSAGRVTSILAAQIAVRATGLGISPKTFVRDYVDPKYPGWSTKPDARGRLGRRVSGLSNTRRRKQRPVSG